MNTETGAEFNMEPMGGLTEVVPGIYKLRGFEFPGVVTAYSDSSWGNLSYKWAAQENPEEVERVRLWRRELADDLGLNPNRFVQMSICHSDHIEVVTSANACDIANRDEALMIPATDALITAEKGIGLFLLTGDCLSVNFFDKTRRVIALTHAGRRGAILDLPVKVVERMMAEFGSKPQDIVAGIGPAVGPECYVFQKVPDDVPKTPEWEKYLPDEPGGKGINFVGYTVDRLRSLGVTVVESGNCTNHNPQFFSHAKSIRNHAPEKRFATVIAMV